MEDLVQIGNQKGSVSKKKLFIRTFGCQMNEYDSQKLYRILDADFEPTENLKEADCVIVNTCSVREKPEHKLYSYLGELEELRAEKGELLVGVGGCVAQQEGDKIIKRGSGVDFVFGTHNLSVVPSLIKRRKQGFAPQVAVNYREDWEVLPFGFTGESRVSIFVAISRGCNKNCTYCIVPTTRGPEVSRPYSEIEREIKLSAHRGAREVVLLGQTVNSYGLDLNPRMKFSELVSRISEIPGVERIRFTSPHPQEIREDFIELATRNQKVCRHIHMPLQSGSNRILKLMNRNYKREKYLQIISELKNRVPDIAITTDVIVGFPSETEAEFDETMQILQEVEFDTSFSFMFSPRPGTKAAEMTDDVPEDVKLIRLKRYQALQNEIMDRKLKSWIGKTVEVLIDGPSKYDAKKLQGRTSQNWMLNFEELDENLSPGNLVQVKVNGTSNFTLKGKAI